MTTQGVNVSLIDINKSGYTFEPDIKNNAILYGLKPLSRMNDEIIEKIVAGRPYSSIKDFMKRCPLKKVIMINLIKAGAFDNMEFSFKTRQETMCYYLMAVGEMKTRLTLQNLNGLIQHKLVPMDLYEKEVRVFEFSKYLKKLNFVLDNRSINFINSYLPECNDYISTYNGALVLDKTSWEKIIYKGYMDNLRDWINTNKEEILRQYNISLFEELWNKYASGTVSKWEMDSICFYHGEHELAHINNNRYGIKSFEDMPSEPIVESYWKRKGHEIPIYQLSKIAGTVIGKDDTKHTVTLLTTTGVVTVKFTGDYYALFKKQISQINADGSKTVVEKGWFSRGTKLLIQGFRRDDQFVSKNYKNSGGHQLYKIIDVVGDEIKIQYERATGIEEDEIDEY